LQIKKLGESIKTAKKKIPFGENFVIPYSSSSLLLLLLKAMVCARGGATCVLCLEVTFSWTQVAEDKKNQEGDDDHNDDDDDEGGDDELSMLMMADHHLAGVGFLIRILPLFFLLGLCLVCFFLVF
jgi:hypothetical protein